MFDSNNFTLSSMRSFQNECPIKRKAVYTLLLFHIFIYLLVRIGSDDNSLAYFFNTSSQILVNLQAVRGITSGGKFYRLLPDKENTAYSFGEKLIKINIKQMYLL